MRLGSGGAAAAARQRKRGSGGVGQGDCVAHVDSEGARDQTSDDDVQHAGGHSSQTAKREKHNSLPVSTSVNVTGSDYP